MRKKVALKWSHHAAIPTISFKVLGESTDFHFTQDDKKAIVKALHEIPDPGNNVKKAIRSVRFEDTTISLFSYHSIPKIKELKGSIETALHSISTHEFTIKEFIEVEERPKKEAG